MIASGKAVRSSIVIFAAILILVIATGCVGNNQSGNNQSVVNTNPETTQVSYDMSLVITVGNRSYIPINEFGKPGDDPSSILFILEAFEDTHPELEVIGWEIDKQQRAHYTSPKIFGIWVDHRLSE